MKDSLAIPAPSRRDFLHWTASSRGGAALAGLLGRDTRGGGGSRDRSPSDILVAGESWAGSVTHYSGIYPDGAISWDPARHGPGLLSNYLWLDMHVDNTVPQPLPPSQDPWMVLRPGAPHNYPYND